MLSVHLDFSIMATLFGSYYATNAGQTVFMEKLLRKINEAVCMGKNYTEGDTNCILNRKRDTTSKK